MSSYQTIEVWDNFAKAKQAVFFRLVKNLYGRDLRAMLQIFVMQSISFSGTGKFFGLSDLAEMYKHKPAQLEYIRANTRELVAL